MQPWSSIYNPSDLRFKKIEKQKIPYLFLPAYKKSNEMAIMNYESNLDTQGMFSMCTHQRVKEKKKSDRKAGKERRKAEKTLLQSHIDFRLLFVQQLLDLSSGALLEMPTAEKPKVEKPLAEKPTVEKIVAAYPQDIIDEQTAYFEHYAHMEYELDMLDLLEAQETEFQIRLQKMKKIWAEEEAVQDDYIPEIDDDYDF